MVGAALRPCIGRILRRSRYMQDARAGKLSDVIGGAKAMHVGQKLHLS